MAIGIFSVHLISPKGFKSDSLRTGSKTRTHHSCRTYFIHCSFKHSESIIIRTWQNNARNFRIPENLPVKISRAFLNWIRSIWSEWLKSRDNDLPHTVIFTDEIRIFYLYLFKKRLRIRHLLYTSNINHAR